MRLSRTVFEIDSSDFCGKSQLLPTPVVFNARRGKSLWNYVTAVAVEKLESFSYQMVKRV